MHVQQGTTHRLRGVRLPVGVPLALSRLGNLSSSSRYTPPHYAPHLPGRLSTLLSYARVHGAGLSLLLWPATLSADYSHAALPLAAEGEPLLAIANLPAALTYAAVPLLSAFLLRRAAPRELCRGLLSGQGGAAAAASASGAISAAASARGGAVRDARALLWWWAVLLLAYAPASHVVAPLAFVARSGGSNSQPHSLDPDANHGHDSNPGPKPKPKPKPKRCFPHPISQPSLKSASRTLSTARLSPSTAITPTALRRLTTLT